MIFDAPNTKRNQIAAFIAIILGLGVGFFMSFSGKKGDADEAPKPLAVSETPVARQVPSAPAVSETVQPPATPQILPAGRMEDIDFNAYSQDLAQGFGLELGETRLDSIDKIRLYFSPEPGTNMVSMTSSTFERDDGSVLLFARNNIPDDAIFSEEIYAVFSGPKADKFNQKLAAYGVRQKCRRGDKAMEWTTELCP